MTEPDTVLADDELRLYDVLLEEELAAPADGSKSSSAIPRRVAPIWLLVAALLGITAVARTWLEAGRAPSSVAVSPQDPPRKVVPFLAAHLPEVVAIRLRVGLVADERGGGFLDPDLPPLVIQEAAAVAAWRDALARHIGADDNHLTASQYRIELYLGDGTMMVGRVDADGQCRFGDLRFVGDDGLKALVGDAVTAARRARGVATSIDELAQLPTHSRAIAVPWLSGQEARTSLARFPDLESITFLGTRSVTGNDLALGLAGIRSLREVHLLAGHLHDDAVRTLATMPNLRMLVIGQDPRAIPAAELGVLVQRLEVLRVTDGPLTDAQLAAIGNAPRLRELWLSVDRPIQPVVDCLLSLPRLRRLSVARHDVDDESDQLMRSIASTRVEELRLVGSVIAVDSLAPLADLPTLHTLVLERVGTRDSRYPALAGLQRLRHLQIENEGGLVNSVREQLPACAVHTDSPLDRWRSPFARRGW